MKITVLSDVTQYSLKGKCLSFKQHGVTFSHGMRISDLIILMSFVISFFLISQSYPEFVIA
jgi:hypothetical protein